MADDLETRKIMTKPLPQILDEIEHSIRQANAAAKTAREAAEAARSAGEKAASEAARVAAEKIARVEQKADRAMELADLLKQAIIESADAAKARITGQKGPK